jgi:hypothetical protein
MRHLRQSCSKAPWRSSRLHRIYLSRWEIMPVVRSHVCMSEDGLSECSYHVMVRSRYNIPALSCSGIAIPVLMVAYVVKSDFDRK